MTRYLALVISCHGTLKGGSFLMGILDLYGWKMEWERNQAKTFVFSSSDWQTLYMGTIFLSFFLSFFSSAVFFSHIVRRDLSYMFRNLGQEKDRDGEIRYNSRKYHPTHIKNIHL